MKFLLPLTIALLLLGAAACTQAKPAVPTPTLVPVNQTPALPLGADTPIPVPGTPQPVPTATGPTTEPTLFPTPAPSFPTAVPPAATPAPSGGAPTTGGCPNPYTVQRGEWLNQIARNCGTTYLAIAMANGIPPPYTVYPGQVLRIPGGAPPQPGGGPPPGTGGKTYVVRPGDTLYSIAARSGTTVYAILQANPGLNPNFIYVGQVIRIP